MYKDTTKNQVFIVHLAIIHLFVILSFAIINSPVFYIPVKRYYTSQIGGLQKFGKEKIVGELGLCIMFYLGFNIGLSYFFRKRESFI